MPDRMTGGDGTPTGAKGLLGISIDRYRLDELTSCGALQPAQRRMALDLVHPPRQWAQWTMALLVAFGTGLVLTGVIYFFAYNWDAVPDLVKLGGLQIAVVLATGGAWWLGPDRLAGRMSLIAATCLVGVFLAVFGQIYQTGADSWQLFALWAALITPWTLVSRMPVLWLIWLVLVNLAVTLWWEISMPRGDPFDSHQLMLHAAILATVLVLREWLVMRTRARSRKAKGARRTRAYRPRDAVEAAPRGLAGPQRTFRRPLHGNAAALQDGNAQARQQEGTHWAATSWTRWLLLAGLLIVLFPPLMEWTTRLRNADGITVLYGLVCAGVTGALFLMYRRIEPDLQALAMLCLMLCLLVTVVAASTFDDMSISSTGTVLLTGITVLITFGAATTWLRRLHEAGAPTLAMRGRQDGEGQS